ncbi:MAG TPA: hypothetical protein PLC80_18260, partial [Draconibacterium sp.]|nr:hypothetical protein [Draconibacterium sp.]
MMRKKFLKALWIFVTGMALISSCSKPEPKNLSQVISLKTDWKIQSSEKLVGTEDQSISENGFDVSGWYEGVVPGTVMG